MAGKRVLDLVALFNASRGVARKHIALTTRRVEVYNKTSTLAATVRSQTDRLTETAKAASFLASRLNEKAPAWASEAEEGPSSRPSRDRDPIPSRESTEGKAPASESKTGLEQDHFYERSKKNSTVDTPPTQDLHVQQEKAGRYPLPDGTIPPQESDLNIPTLNDDVVSTRPQDESSKNPLNTDGLRPTSSNKSSIPIPHSKPLPANAARASQRQSEQQIPSKTAGSLKDSAGERLNAGYDEDSFYQKSGHASPTLSSLPRVKIPRHPSDTQGGGIILQDSSLNSDSFYTAGKLLGSVSIPSVEAIPEQDQVLEGINTDLFHSPRVARMLGGKTQGIGKNNLQMQASRGTPIDQTTLAENKDQDTFNVLNSSQREPKSPVHQLISKQNASADLDGDIEKFADDISKETNRESIKVKTPAQSIGSI